MGLYNLIDVWRFLNPWSKRFTRREMSRNGLVQTRLDYWLVSNHMLYDFDCQNIDPGMRSDHSLVKICFTIKCTQKKGRGFFKFNASLLRDEKYIKDIKEIMIRFKEIHKEEEDYGLLWDTLKCEVRGFTISYASARAKERQAIERDLRVQLEKLEKKLNDDNFLEYSTIKRELQQINQEYAIGAQLRSKAKFIEENEENLSFFKKEETRNYNMRYIRALFIDNDVLINEPELILKEEELFYKKLYTQPNNGEIDENLFSSEHIPKLSEDSITLCDADITIEELGKALKDLPNKKSPGSDGLTTEFYKKIGLILKK